MENIKISLDSIILKNLYPLIPEEMFSEGLLNE